MHEANLPPIESLRCFIAVAEHLSFRRAASELGLSPGAVSQRIRQLEDLVDAQLFDRSSRHVQLTGQGRQLLPRAQAAIEAVRGCVLVDEAAPRRARFSIGTRFELGLSWLVPAVVALGDTHPHWAIDLVFGSGGEILDRLEAGTVDAIVTSAPVANERWAARTLHEESYVVVTSRGRQADAPIEHPVDAADHPLLDIDRSLPLARYAQSVLPGLTFGDVRCCGTGAAVLAMVRSGVGVAVLPEYMVRGDLQDGALVRLFAGVELLRDTFRLLFREGSPLAATFDELAEQLRNRPLQ